MESRAFILGLTGASGSPYFIRMLSFLLENHYKCHVVLSPTAYRVLTYETGFDIHGNPFHSKQKLLEGLGFTSKNDLLDLYDPMNMFASIASGSFKTDGMIILPCSMNTVALIKNGISSNLLCRAADVTLKQGRPLVLAPREMPFSAVHLENMLALSKLGVNILVPSPGFYNHPQSIDDMIDFVVGKVLDSIGVPNELYKRWE